MSGYRFQLLAFVALNVVGCQAAGSCPRPAAVGKQNEAVEPRRELGERRACGDKYDCLAALAGAGSRRLVQRLAVHTLMQQVHLDGRACSLLERLLSDKNVRRLIREGRGGDCGFNFPERAGPLGHASVIGSSLEIVRSEQAQNASLPSGDDSSRLKTLGQLYDVQGADIVSFRFAVRLASDPSSALQSEALTLSLKLANRLSDAERIVAEDILYSFLERPVPLVWRAIVETSILPPSERVMRRLHELLESGDMDLEVPAARALYVLGEVTPRVIRTILDSLGDEAEGGTAQVLRGGRTRSQLVRELASPLAQARMNATWQSARAEGSLYDVPIDFWALMLLDPYRESIFEALRRMRELDRSDMPEHPLAREVWQSVLGADSKPGNLTEFVSKLSGASTMTRQALLSIAMWGEDGAVAIDGVLQAAYRPELSGLAIAVLGRIGAGRSRERALRGVWALANGPLCESVVPHLGGVLHALGTEEQRLRFLRASNTCVQLVGLHSELL